MRAIPKKLLIHTVIYAKAIEADRWGAEKLTDEQELSRVRVEPSSRIVRDKSGAEIQLAATMFYDCRNSRPSGTQFVPDDIIIFNGQKHSIKLVEPLYDEGKLHHYELGLIAHA